METARVTSAIQPARQGLGPDGAMGHPGSAHPGFPMGWGDEDRLDAEFAAAPSILAGRREVLLDGPLPLDHAVAVVEGRAEIAIGDEAAQRMRDAHRRLVRCIDEGRVVYGVTTGFGPLSDRLVSPADIETLQRNLVYHLASGVGAPMPWAAARATVLARLSSMAQGWSGVSADVVDLMVGLLNSPYAPRIPEKGTVGASGDLTPLSHMALALMGEGAFINRYGAPVDALSVFETIGRPPMTLAARDGLALVNGTSAMTGVAAVNGAVAERLLQWSETLAVAQAELLGGRIEAWRPEFSAARPHPGQIRSAAALRRLADGADRIDRAAAAEQRLAPEMQSAGAHERRDAAMQDPYTLRCAPQLFGAARDVLSFHQSVTERELNAATDNPIFIDDAPGALHGGNFMGAHIAQASDALSNTVIMLAGAAERRIARLTDEKRNGGLPAFLHRGQPGLNSGFMGAQVTATALLAEMRARGGPASVQSISTNADNQDVVSMGTIAARGAAEALTALSQILAIEALAVAQAMEITAPDAFDSQNVDAAGAMGGFSASSIALWRATRRGSGPLTQDRPLSGDIEIVAAEFSKAAP